MDFAPSSSETLGAVHHGARLRQPQDRALRHQIVTAAVTRYGPGTGLNDPTGGVETSECGDPRPTRGYRYPAVEHDYGRFKVRSPPTRHHVYTDGNRTDPYRDSTVLLLGQRFDYFRCRRGRRRCGYCWRSLVLLDAGSKVSAARGNAQATCRSDVTLGGR
jgi:hypothetical protein